MPRRSIRLPTCLQERLVPLLRLVFLPPSSSPKPFPSSVLFQRSPLPWCYSGFSLSHHFCSIRSHLVVYLPLFLMTHMGCVVGLQLLLCFFIMLGLSLHAKWQSQRLLCLVEVGHSQLPSQRDSSVVCLLSSCPQYICRSTLLSYSLTHTLILLYLIGAL